jgi:hypothetical protein
MNSLRSILRADKALDVKFHGARACAILQRESSFFDRANYARRTTESPDAPASGVSPVGDTTDQR